MDRTESDQHLIFSWRDREGTGWRLAGWLAITIVLVGGVFLLFQVIYPQSRHHITYPQEILVFDASQPATRALLSRVRDRDYLLIPPDTGSLAKAQEALPVFRPSFQDFSVKLRALPAVRKPLQTPRIFSADDLPLPPLVLPALDAGAQPAADEPAGGGKPQVLRLKITGALAERTLESPRELPGVALTDTSSARFRVYVGAAGNVTLALPLSRPDETPESSALMKELHRRVAGLRFAAAPGAPAQAGDVFFQWERAD